MWYSAGALPQRIRVLFSEEVRMLGSRHRHKGALMNQTLLVAGAWGMCEPGRGECDSHLLPLGTLPSLMQPKLSVSILATVSVTHSMHLQVPMPCLTFHSSGQPLPAACWAQVQHFHMCPSDILSCYTQMKAPHWLGSLPILLSPVSPAPEQCPAHIDTH